jgi:hypothetical protein
MTYEEFVGRYCDGMTPTAAQEVAIRNALQDPGGQVIWTGGRASGKATVRAWLTRYFDDLRRQGSLAASPVTMPEGVCGKPFDRADDPWTYRCVLPAGHRGDCDPQLRPPGPGPAEPPAGTPSEALFGPWLGQLRGMDPEQRRGRTLMLSAEELLAAADAIDGLTEEVANLSSEGLLRMGLGHSPIRYHAHGEVLWPVAPTSGMCRGCG